MNLNEVRPDIRVRITDLHSTIGMMIAPKYLEPRAVGAEGKVLSHVGGHGGDVWWVQHDAGDVAAYCFNEFEPI